MKLSFKTLALLVAGAMTLACGAALSAQKRSTAKKRTATSSTARTSATRTAHGSFTAKSLENNTLLAYSHADKLGIGQGLLIFSSIVLDPNDVTWYFSSKEFGAKYTVTGNTFRIVSNKLVITATSTNGGRSFNGTFVDFGKCVLYNVTRPASLTADDIRDKLINGTFRAAYLEINKDETVTLAVPVTVKFTPGENENEGVYKVSGDNAVLTALGILKGNYAFVKNVLMITDVEKQTTFSTSLNAGGSADARFFLKRASIPGSQNLYDMYVRIIY